MRTITAKHKTRTLHDAHLVTVCRMGQLIVIPARQVEVGDMVLNGGESDSNAKDHWKTDGVSELIVVTQAKPEQP